MSTQQPTPEEVIGCQAALFEWAESFDTKDWGRLRGCLAPTMRVDYTHVMGKLWENMPADDFIPLASNPHFLGDPLLKTQHFLGGASSWTKLSDHEIRGRHQVRVAHQRYTDGSLKEVALKGHAHGGATMWYRRGEEDGVWKFAGLCPDIRWSEYDYDKMFGQH
ncbi:Scytalone dehydratase [Apiospora aurea]|uniref:Scytalone dehydratase n=1 Tax=Apiospora aurea TaxID=335848 RepID=A0ABR1PSA4_9PEZI